MEENSSQEIDNDLLNLPEITMLTICRDGEQGYDVSALALLDKREACIDSSERADFFRSLLDLTSEKAEKFSTYHSIKVAITSTDWDSWLAGYELVEDIDPAHVASYLAE